MGLTIEERLFLTPGNFENADETTYAGSKATNAKITIAKGVSNFELVITLRVNAMVAIIHTNRKVMRRFIFSFAIGPGSRILEIKMLSNAGQKRPIRAKIP